MGPREEGAGVGVPGAEGDGLGLDSWTRGRRSRGPRIPGSEEGGAGAGRLVPRAEEPGGRDSGVRGKRELGSGLQGLREEGAGVGTPGFEVGGAAGPGFLGPRREGPGPRPEAGLRRGRDPRRIGLLTR